GGGTDEQTFEASRPAESSSPRARLSENPRDVGIVEKPNRQRQGERVEEAVVAGGRDRYLKAGSCHESDPPELPRREGERGGQALDDQGHERRNPLHPARKVMRVPAERGRERLGLVVMTARRERSPGRIARVELGDATLEEEPEREGAHEEH